jgi:pimeloyl-ACP methyl ester carboxylesterase
MHEEALVVLPALLHAFDVTHPVLIGHSDGGSIALIYEGVHSGAATALILEAPHVFVEDVTVASIAQLEVRYRSTDLRARLMRHHTADVDALVNGWTGVWLRPEFRSWNIEEYLSTVRAPTLVIQGTDDEYGTARQVDAIAQALGERCESMLLPQCGHAPHVDQRARVEDAMAGFIARVTRSR